jgi:small subunit ribosomal protein S15
MARQKKLAEKPVWLKVSEEELKKIIAELAEKYPPAQIGLILRDQYGIPTARLYGKKLSHYIKEIGKYNEKMELENISKKVEKIEEHFKKNPQDKRTKHKLQKAKSRVEIKKRYLS